MFSWFLSDPSRFAESAHKSAHKSPTRLALGGVRLGASLRRTSCCMSKGLSCWGIDSGGPSILSRVARSHSMGSCDCDPVSLTRLNRFPVERLLYSAAFGAALLLARPVPILDPPITRLFGNNGLGFLPAVLSSRRAPRRVLEPRRLAGCRCLGGTSTVKKSAAAIASQCAFRNFDQGMCGNRSGAGPIPRSRSSRRTVDRETRCPSFDSSPTIRV